MPLVGNPQDWSIDTRQAVIRDALAVHAPQVGGSMTTHSPRDCAVCVAAWRALVPQLGTGSLRFSKRVDGVMTELPQGRERSRRLKNTVHEVHAYIADGDWRVSEPSAAASEPLAEASPAPVSTGVNAEAQRLLAEIRRLRTFASDRDVDHISYRPVKDGAAMLKVGIPVAAILNAMTMHWETATRRQAGIRDYDPASEFPGGLDAYLRKLVEARVLIMLTGPAGMGKSYWCENLASDLGLEFGSIACNDQATPSWLLGKETMGGLKTSRFAEIWRNGGVFLFDEMDAADSNFLMTVNNALANGVLDNNVSGERIPRHPDCIVIAATNTLGMGADDMYVGRNQLDFSTLDRFRMGRAFVGYNANVEDAIFAASL